MTIYTCKCGKTFQKNTGAGTTGFRMPDYGPEHECYGCPFVCKIMTWDPITQQQAVQNHECRGSKKIRYDTTAGINTADKCTADIHTLDFNFLMQIHTFVESLDGFEPDRYFFDNRSSAYGDDGRYRYTLYPTQNKKGISAKVALKERFFNPDGSRKDITPEQEKEIVLNQIRKTKEEAKAMNSYYAPCGHKFSRSAGGVPEITIEVTGTTQDCSSCPHALHEPGTDDQGPKISCVCSRKKVEPADTPITFEESMAPDPEPVEGKKYQHSGRVYFVRPYQNGTYRAFFYFIADPSEVIACGSISPANTLEEAQAILDAYAVKHGYEVYESTSEVETPPESDLSSDDAPAEAAGEPEDEAAAQPEQAEEMNELAGRDDVPDSADSEPGSDNNSDDSEDDSEVSGNAPCDWKNASGADQDDEEAEAPAKDIPAGELVSLRDDAFSTLIDICDNKINQALRTMFELRQNSFSFTAKITFERRGGAFGIKHETGFNFDPIKVKDKGELYDEIPIQLDEDGNPIIPYDRKHQINFDELQPGREIPPSGTATVDGNTGIVEDYQEDGEEPEDPPVGDDITDSVVSSDLEEDGEPPQLLPPCDKHDCPFFALGVDEDSGCCFDEFNEEDGSFAGDVWEAINMHDCKREKVLDAYRMNNPDDDYDGSDEPEDPDILSNLDDLPEEYHENNEEDFAS